MSKTKTKTRRKTTATVAVVQPDSTYILKLVLYVIIGSQWLWLVDAGNTQQIPLPIGLLIGLLFASHDHFQLDRKIEYAAIIVAMFIGFWLNTGIYLTVLK